MPFAFVNSGGEPPLVICCLLHFVQAAAVESLSFVNSAH